MSWRKIPMKFPGTCIICNEKILVNEIGLWAKGLGVKHEKCAQINELHCIVCGASAGCSHCEFRENCDISNVSQLCICKKCSENTDAFSSYQTSSNKKFPILNS
jgi:hypothetical protein|tara:strand:- start:1140 stop:1451 length:312 start_codon:yes stop_codon:yes gene_type:complete